MIFFFFNLNQNSRVAFTFMSFILKLKKQNACVLKTNVLAFSSSSVVGADT